MLTVFYDANIVFILFQYVLEYIPTPVLDGLFLYLAITALYGNQMFERFTLLFTEQVSEIRQTTIYWQTEFKKRPALLEPHH